MNLPDPARVGHVLIRANNWIGDVVMIGPAVRAVRRHYRSARIAILAKDWVLEALRGNPDYDELIAFDEGGRHRGIAGRLRLAADLRRRRFEVALLFQKAFEAAALAFMAGVPVRIGYASDARRLLLTHPLPPPPPDQHHLDAFLGIARAIGCPVDDATPAFHLAPEWRAAAESRLRAAGLEEARPLIALHPGASKIPRAWHPERFATVAARLAEDPGARFVLIGGPADRPLFDAVAGALPPARVLTTGDLPLTISAAVLARCHLFIGNDSGPMHLAAALGVPTVALFGPGSPRRTAPRGRGPVLTLGRDYPCSPCRQDFFRECVAAPSGRPFCLEEIRAGEVVQAARSLLDRKG
jgi:heptosyltransferase-2